MSTGSRGLYGQLAFWAAGQYSGPVSTGPREKPYLLDLLALEDESTFHVGGRICVLRLGRPWRICTVEALSDQVLTVETGHEYDVRTGLPLKEAKGIQIQPLKRQHVEYLLVIEFQKVTEKLNLRQLKEEQWRLLLPAATQVLALLQEHRLTISRPPHEQPGASQGESRR